MEKLVCKYCKDEICVNDQCPLVADYCPVVNVAGVCKHEERVSPHKTPKECLKAAMEEIDFNLDEDPIYADRVWKDFKKLLENNGYTIAKIVDQKPTENLKNFEIGNTITLVEVENSPDWKIKTISTNPLDMSCTYVNERLNLMAHFSTDSKLAVIEKNSKFHVGQRVTVSTIHNSNDWRLVGKCNNTLCYESIDQTMSVTFVDGANWSTIFRQK